MNNRGYHDRLKQFRSEPKQNFSQPISSYLGPRTEVYKFIFSYASLSINSQSTPCTQPIHVSQLSVQSDSSVQHSIVKRKRLAHSVQIQ